MGVGGFDQAAANGGHMLGWSRASPPAPTRDRSLGPQLPHPPPPHPKDSFIKDLGAIRRTLDM